MTSVEQTQVTNAHFAKLLRQSDWTPCLHSHMGYGIDDPDDDDLSANPADFQRERNETVFANLIWDANAALRIGFEITYRETDNTSTLDNHGMGYQTQVRWSF